MDTLHDLLTAHETARGGERPDGLTASGATPICQRQTALRLHGTPTTDPVEPVTAATVGTLIHDAVARVWAAHDPDAIIERRGAHGQADVIRPPHREVRDLKTVGGHIFDRWADDDGPGDGIWNQLRIYAHDHGADDGWLLVVDALDREKGRCATYTAPYTRAEGAAAVAALEALEADLLALTDPWHAEPDGAYGADWVCERCPFRTPCGRGTVPQSNQPVTVDDPAAIAAVEQYRLAADMEAEAKTLKARARAMLAGVEGVVNGYAVKWVTRKGLPERVLPPTEPTTYLSIRKAKK